MIFPSLSEFQSKATQGNLIPVFREILADNDTPVSAYERLRTVLRREKACDDCTHTFLLESVEGGETAARYSFLGGGAHVIYKGRGRQVDVTLADGTTERHEDVEPLSIVQTYMARYRPVPEPGLPSFTGGAVGMLGYDAVAQFDKVPLCKTEGLDWPDLFYILADDLIIFDRARHTIKLVANAFIPDGADAATIDAAYADACERIGRLERALETEMPRRLQDVHANVEPLPLRSNFSKPDFINAVETCKEYIRSGDIIQVVLSQRFEVDGADDPLDVYRALRSINPSPYMFCLEFGECVAVGSSPEIHVRSEKGKVTIRPIAGTRKRKANPEEDKAMEVELLADPKERAEHVMLVDLARNDIGRVCKWGSVEVDDFMSVERYSHVMHIVSNVVGELAEDKNAYDLMRATFPAGTLTGAPKIRAMEIIADLEKNKRVPYGGAIGYFGFDGDGDCCITIRTVFIDGDKSYVQAGAGIVADSVPELEFEETENKARGMLQALAIARNYNSANSAVSTSSTTAKTSTGEST